MNPHALSEYLKYLWRAKKLHGVHSPFAYSFSEDVLYTSATAKQADLSTLQLPDKYKKLIARIKDKYNYGDPCYVSNTALDQPLTNMIMLTEGNPGNWLQLFNKYYPAMPCDAVVIIPGIHNTPRHSKKWKRLHIHPKILMSIDLYGIGLIFFKKEFKEKQHFILRY